MAPSEVNFSKHGVIKMIFNRDIYYPRELISSYEPAYREKVPDLKPTKEEETNIKKEFEQLEKEYEDILKQSLESAQEAYDSCMREVEQ